MSGEWSSFWTGILLGGPAWLGATAVYFWVGDLIAKLNTKARRKRYAALSAKADEREAHNTADLSNTLMQVGIEFHDQMAKVLIADGWTK